MKSSDRLRLNEIIAAQQAISAARAAVREERAFGAIANQGGVKSLTPAAYRQAKRDALRRLTAMNRV